jgi:hypothetical protein
MIDAQANALKAAAQIHPDGWIWIFVGRIVKDKGMAELLEYFVELQNQFQSIHSTELSRLNMFELAILMEWVILGVCNVNNNSWALF